MGHPPCRDRRPAAGGWCRIHSIFTVRVHGLAEDARPGVASLGVRPTVEDAGRVLLEVHVLREPDALGSEGGSGRLAHVELLHKRHEEIKDPTMDALREGIARLPAEAAGP